jgi:cytochrome c peroxidase
MKRWMIVVLVVIGILFIQANIIRDVPASKAELGKLLFFDPVLSKDSTVSCASCHRPGYAFADTSAVSIGVDDRKGTRNTPTAMNLRLGKSFFWDGRSKTLEEQALAPIENPNEMNLPIDEAVVRLRNSRKYNNYFLAIFKDQPSTNNLAVAIAAFERTLETSDSPFDNWKFSDDSNAVSDAAKRGFVIFNEKGKCVKCHFGADFANDEFRNIGLFNGKNLNDSGRAVITGKPEDIGRFKISSLRNIGITAPYMHNGLFKTLDEVIDFYDDTKKVIPNAINKDSVLIDPLGLTKKEKLDLKAFLLSLTDKQFEKAK